MNRIQKILCIGAMTALLGCQEKPSTLSQEYQPKQKVEESNSAIFSVESERTLEGKIIDIQNSVYSYCDGDHYQTQGMEYIAVEDSSKNIHLLIYPFSKYIQKKNATIKFRPLSQGYIDVETFVKTFISKDLHIHIYNPILEAEGIVVGNGIKYK